MGKEQERGREGKSMEGRKKEERTKVGREGRWKHRKPPQFAFLVPPLPSRVTGALVLHIHCTMSAVM